MDEFAGTAIDSASPRDLRPWSAPEAGCRSAQARAAASTALQALLRGHPVGLEMVLAAEVVVVHPGRVGTADVDFRWRPVSAVRLVGYRLIPGHDRQTTHPAAINESDPHLVQGISSSNKDAIPEKVQVNAGKGGGVDGRVMPGIDGV